MKTTVIDLMASDAFIIQSQTHILVGFTVALFMLHAASVSQQCLIARLNISMHNSLGPLSLSLSLHFWLLKWESLFWQIISQHKPESSLYIACICAPKRAVTESFRIMSVYHDWAILLNFHFNFLPCVRYGCLQMWVCSFNQPLPFRY